MFCENVIFFFWVRKKREFYINLLSHSSINWIIFLDCDINYKIK